MRDRTRCTPVPVRFALRMIGSRNGPRAAAVRSAAPRTKRAPAAAAGRVRATTVPTRRLLSDTTFQPAGATHAASRSKREGEGGGACSVNDRMSLCGLGPEGSSEAGVGAVTIVVFPLLRLYNPEPRLALRWARRLVPKGSVADQDPLLPQPWHSAGLPFSVWIIEIRWTKRTLEYLLAIYILFRSHSSW